MTELHPDGRASKTWQRIRLAGAALVAAACLAPAAQAQSVTLSEGHLDYGARLVDGSLRSQVKDGTKGGTPVWRDTDSVLVAVGPNAKRRLPEGAGLDFVGPAGSEAWVIPQVQEPGIPWLGWNTEELGPPVTGTTWRLVAAEGPGKVAVFTTGALGGYDVLFNSADGLPDERAVPTGVHAHGNWTFTAAGTYRLTFQWVAARSSGEPLVDTRVLTVRVTDVPGPDGATPDGPGPPPAPGGGPPAPGTPSAPPTGGAPTAREPATKSVVRVGSARIEGRMLRVRLSLRERRRISVSLRRRGRTIATAAPRSVAAGTRVVRLRLTRRPAAGLRYTARIVARRGRSSVVRTLTVRAPGATGRAAASGKVVLDDGHLDFGVRLRGGRLRHEVKDGTRRGRTVWRKPERVVVHVRQAARTRLPSGGALAFAGRPGQTVWMIPQVQRAGIVWAGWNTEELRRSQVRGGVRWTLDRVRGPGRVTVFQTGAFGRPDVLFSSARLPASRTIPIGTHAHGNWTFSRPGTYRLTFTWRMTTRAGKRLRDTGTVTFAVGAVDPRRA